MVETVWGLCRKSKWVRMATCYVFYLFIYLLPDGAEYSHRGSGEGK